MHRGLRTPARPRGRRVAGLHLRQVSTHRILKLVNLCIAVLLILFLGAAFWYAWRPLPVTSGTITAPVSAQAVIARDAIGVPHIVAANWEDAVFLQGFVTAQDRMWQLDATRRLAAGELSEIVGKVVLETDRESRPTAPAPGQGQWRAE